jgi:nucleotide-binding universal stress UspA family protein
LIKAIKEKQFSKILIPIDGSDQSMKAADYAIEVAIKYNAQLIVLHVIHIT